MLLGNSVKSTKAALWYTVLWYYISCLTTIETSEPAAKWEEKTLILITSFYPFTLVYFIFHCEFCVSVKFCRHALSPSLTRVCDRLKTSTSHNTASSANSQPLASQNITSTTTELPTNQ